MAKNYVPTIGMEVHAQLRTRSKMFCSCSSSFGDPPNTHLCPVCLGLPGTLPMVNHQAVILGLRAARALSCTIHPIAQFARKNYFYPDLPKGYQISMYEHPVGSDGELEVIDSMADKRRMIGIERVHLEEDTAKLFHESEAGSLIDFNRAGVPLIEIVSRPDIVSAGEAVKYLKELRRLLRFLGISDANMDEGSFRCEVNVSVHPEDSEEFGTKVEIKNLNSFRAVERSIEYEIQRQTALYRTGSEVRQATMGWDEKTGVTVHQRYKEDAPEYRYFPEPDIPDLVFEGSLLDESTVDMADIPVNRIRSLIERFGVPPTSADLLVSGTGSPVDNPYFVADFFEEAVQNCGAQCTQTVNLMVGTVFEFVNRTGITLDQTDLTAKKLAMVTKMVMRDELSSTNAKAIVMKILEEGGKVKDIVMREGLVQVTDQDELTTLAKEIIEENEQAVESVRKGRENAIGALVGAAMKKSGGQADPKRLNELFREMLLKKR